MGLGELNEHTDDAEQERTALAEMSVVNAAATLGNVEGSGALGGGALGDAVEATLFGWREFASTFGNIERDRRCGTLKLIS